MSHLLNGLLHPGKVWKQRAAIKEGIDNLPYGICFAYTTGIVILCNRTMDNLARRLEGHALQDGYSFWSMVEENGTLISDQTFLLDQGENGIWLLSREERRLENRDVYAMEAQDATQLCRLNEKLEQENRQLLKLAQRLKQYSEDVQELTRKRELLERRSHTHDEMGRLLVETRQYLSTGVSDLDQLLPRWRLNASLIQEEARDFEIADLFNELQQVATSIGVNIQIRGDFPTSSYLCEIILAAGAESLTNLIRHGQGNELNILSRQKDQGWLIRLSNNGILPQGPVHEGGGLSTLRKKVEDVGGSMELETDTIFRLILWLPERRIHDVQNFDCGR